MKRTRHALSGISHRRATKGPKTRKMSTSILPELPSPQLVLYGHSAWNVSPSGAGAIGENPPASLRLSPEARKGPAQLLPRPGVGLPRATRRRRKHRPEGLPAASITSAASRDTKSVVAARHDEQQPGFGILIGLANAIAFEAALLMGGILAWCALSSLTAV